MLESRFLRIIQAIGSTRMVVAAMIELVHSKRPSTAQDNPEASRFKFQYYSQVSNPSVTVISMNPNPVHFLQVTTNLNHIRDLRVTRY